MYVQGVRGDAKIRWDTCDERKFRHDPIFIEAMYCGRITNLHDLAVFLDDSTVLDYLDVPVFQALLELNRNLFDCVETPMLYFYAERHYVLVFRPEIEDVYIGVLEDDEVDDDVLPEPEAWMYVSIKSML